MTDQPTTPNDETTPVQLILQARLLNPDGDEPVCGDVHLGHQPYTLITYQASPGVLVASITAYGFTPEELIEVTGKVAQTMAESPVIAARFVTNPAGDLVRLPDDMTPEDITGGRGA